MADLAVSTPLEQTLALIKPDAVAAGNANDIVQLTLRAGFTVASKRVCQLTPAMAEEFYAEHKGKPFFPTLVDFMTSGPLCALRLSKPGAIKGWRELIGPTNSTTARSTKPESIRALYGSDGTKNATHGSANSEDAARELAFFFPDPITQASNAQATKDAAAFKSFLQDKLQPALAQGLAALAQLHKKQGSLPGSPVSWLGQWLLDNDPNKFTSPQLQAALAAAGASAGSQPGGPPGGPAPKSALAALAAGGPDTRIDLSSLSFPFAPSRRATAEVEAERLDLGKLAFPFRGTASPRQAPDSAASAASPPLSARSNRSVRASQAGAAPGRASLAGSVRGGGEERIINDVSADALVNNLGSQAGSAAVSHRSFADADGADAVDAPTADDQESLAGERSQKAPVGEPSELASEATEASQAGEQATEEAIEPEAGAPITNQRPRGSVLFVEGRTMEVYDNPGDVDVEDDGREARASTTPSPQVKRQATFFNRGPIPAEDDDEEEEQEGEGEQQQQATPAAQVESAVEAAGEAAKEVFGEDAVQEAIDAEPSGPAIGEASEYETDYTEGATEYTDEEEEEEEAAPAAAE